MRQQALQNRLGVFLVASHFGLVFLIVFLWLMQGFRFDEMTTCIAILTPLLASYTAAVLRKTLAASKRRKPPKERIVPPAEVVITLLPPVLLVAFTALMSVLKSYNVGFSNFDEFKTVIGIGETAFGVYTGIVVTTVFGTR